MTEEEKFQLVQTVFEKEAQLYIQTGKKYDKITEFWLDKYLTKSNFDSILRANLDEIYPIALVLHSQ